MLFHLTEPQANLCLLIALLPVAIWICWSDLKYMKISNRANLTVLAIWLVVGGLTFPPDVYLWRWLNVPVIWLIGFFLTNFAGVGAGDSKFAAAASPYVSAAHLPLVLPLFAAFLLGAFAAHRLLRAIPAVRAATPDWVSWGHKKFPMGLALVGTLLAYLSIMAFPGFYLALFNAATR